MAFYEISKNPQGSDVKDALKASGTELRARKVANIAVIEGLGVKVGAAVAGPLVGRDFSLTAPTKAAAVAGRFVSWICEAALAAVPCARSLGLRIRFGLDNLIGSIAFAKGQS